MKESIHLGFFLGSKESCSLHIHSFIESKNKQINGQEKTCIFVKLGYAGVAGFEFDLKLFGQMENFMLSQFQEEHFLTSVVSVAPQKGDDGEEGVTSEGTVTKLSLFSTAYHPSSPAHLWFCRSNFSPNPTPARV